VLPRLLPLLALLLLGCPSPTPVVPGEDAGTTPIDGGDGLARSAKANVRFKRNIRLTNDFAQALSLAPGDLCKELGLYSCTELVHPLAVGGVDPYNLGLYEPLPFTGATSPIVTDRVALAACVQRVEADLAAPGSAVIFKGLTPDASGKLASLETAEVKGALDALYKRALLRPIAESELTALKGLYRDVEASGKPSPAKSWMELSCFAVLTSVESLFY
jgi:hypothetical protein